MTKTVHLVAFAVLITLGSASLHAAAPGSVSGTVRDSAGVPQIGAEVQMLGADLMVIATVYTDSNGRFAIPSVLPGRYAFKAIGPWFLPSMRENIRVRSNTVVNLTMNTLYEAMQWLPAEPRSGNAQKDDWKWTLRSAANRPLLRWLEDGPLVVVSDGAGAHPRLKARLMASGQEGTFGESGERIAAAIEDTPSDSRELLARVEFDPGSNGDMESMLGFRQDLGFAGSVQSVAAVALHPEMSAADGAGVDEAAVRSWETIHLGDEFEVEAGSTQVLARLSSASPDTVATVLPFASAAWRGTDSAIRYRMTTFLPGVQNGVGAEDSQARSWLPGITARNGSLAIEHGLHQELGWARNTDVSGFGVLVFGDRIDDPVVEAMSHFAAGNSTASEVLSDPMSGLVRAVGPEFSSTGVTANFEHRLPGGNQARVEFAYGNALVMPSSAQPATLERLLAGAHPRAAQSYSLSLSGTLEGTQIRWRASYRWQPEDTVTQVAPFTADAAEPYMNLSNRQPIHLSHDSSGHFYALVDVRNLLAQGYRPYLLSDGSLLIFAQDQRGVSAGLAFNF